MFSPGVCPHSAIGVPSLLTGVLPFSSAALQSPCCALALKRPDECTLGSNLPLKRTPCWESGDSVLLPLRL